MIYVYYRTTGTNDLVFELENTNAMGTVLTPRITYEYYEITPRPPSGADNKRKWPLAKLCIQLLAIMITVPREISNTNIIKKVIQNN